MHTKTSLHKVLFESAGDAQQAFYDAFQRCNIEEMMAVWAEDENIVCIHPGGARLHGSDAIRNSWEQIFSDKPDWDFRLTHGQCVEDDLLSIHQVQENIYQRDQVQGVVIATNLFHYTHQGWRMIMHHASPVPEMAADIITTGRSLH